MPLRLRVIRELDELHGLRDEWNDAAATSVAPNVFLSWDWTLRWWHHFGGNAEPHVVVVQDDEGIVGIAPMMTRRVGVGPASTTVIERISPRNGDYGGIIVTRRMDEVAALLVDHFFDQLRTTRASTVTLSRVTTDDPFLEAWRTACRSSGSLDVVEEALPGASLLVDFAEPYNLAKMAKKHKIRQRMRRLGEQYDDVQVRFHSQDTLEEGIAIFLDVHRRRWASRQDELRGLLADPKSEAFLLDVIRTFDAAGWTRLLTITADDLPVAAELDFEFAGKVVMFKGAFDPDFGEFSPGQLLHHEVIRESSERGGVDIVDFGRGDHPYKERWANGRRELRNLHMVRSGRRGSVARQRFRVSNAVEVRRHSLRLVR